MIRKTTRSVIGHNMQLAFLAPDITAAKDEDEWRIAAHAWDQASEQKPVPEHLC